MTVEVEDVRAWIDGELNERRAREVSDSVSSDDNLKRIARSMRASHLPYSEAYEQVSIPDVPESLRVEIAALRGSGNGAADVDSNADRAASGHVSASVAGNDFFLKAFGVAASVMLAAMVGYLAGSDLSKEAAAPVVALDSNDSLLRPENFAQSVAAYQAFYTRDTLIGTDNSSTVIAAVSERLADQTGMEILIPELEGYEFVRAQHLSYNGEPLLQLVYLGEIGGPLALCYMPAPNATDEFETELDQDKSRVALLREHYGLNTAEWIQKGHRFVIVSDVSEQKLDELSRSAQKQWEI